MVSPYDGETFETLRESTIEHIVALSEAHDSGLCIASAAVKSLFASDLDNLTLATMALKSSEGRRRRLGVAARAEPLLVRRDRRGSAQGVQADDRPAGGPGP